MLDFKLAMKSIPNAFRVSAIDADGEAHPACIVSLNIDREAGQFGITQRGADTLYLQTDFTIGKGNRVEILYADGKRETRRVDTISACPYFLAIDLGEKC